MTWALSPALLAQENYSMDYVPSHVEISVSELFSTFLTSLHTLKNSSRARFDKLMTEKRQQPTSKQSTDQSLTVVTSKMSSQHHITRTGLWIWFGTKLKLKVRKTCNYHLSSIYLRNRHHSNRSWRTFTKSTIPVNGSLWYRHAVPLSKPLRKMAVVCHTTNLECGVPTIFCTCRQQPSLAHFIVVLRLSSPSWAHSRPT